VGIFTLLSGLVLNKRRQLMTKKTVAREVGLYSDFVDGNTLAEVLHQVKELIKKYGEEAYLEPIREYYEDYYVGQVMLYSEEEEMTDG
jgi:hypothetical protein